MIKKYLPITFFVVSACFINFGALAHAQVTSGIGITLPSVPTSVSAAIASQPSQINVSWAASTESSGTIEGYYIYRNGAQITTTAGTSIVDAGLGSGVYSYTVAAYDANGIVSNQSSPSSVTLVKDTMPPTTPTGVAISGVTSTNSFYAQIPLTISWSPSSDNVGVVGYNVYRNGASITSSTAAFTGTSIADVVTPGMYTYTIVAYDAAQNFSGQSTPAKITIAVDSIPPSIPSSVSAQQVSATNVNVLWTASTDSAGITGYQIFRNGIQIASATGSPYADSGLTAGVAYSYRVAAYDVAGNVSSQSSPAANVTMQATNGPQAPYAISATLTGTSTVALSWAPATDALMITSYSVYRNGAQIATVTSTNYLDNGLATGTYYGYNLTATDISGAISPISATSSVITPASASTPAPGVSIPTFVTVIPSAPVTQTASTFGTLTQPLYFGLRSAQVAMLQSLLVQNGDLASAYATGFFGGLTRAAVGKFQCDQKIVCAGGIGWGLVGPRTRNALNTLSEINTLTTELANLQAQSQK